MLNLNDEKEIADIKESIDILRNREKEIENFLDQKYEEAVKNQNFDEYRKLTEEHDEEYCSIDDKIMKLRDDIRLIRDKRLIENGYYYELSLARSNID